MRAYRRLDGRGWFNASAPMWRVGGRYVRLWNLFRSHSRDGRWWGVGLVQVNRRHLLFIGRVQGYPAREVWALSVLFIGRV